MNTINNRPRVLYADDDEDSCFMLSTLLGYSNIDVSLAHTVRDAFQLAQKSYFDLYLLDNRFPDGDGFELCQKLRRLDPQKPIVFYSGDAYESDMQKGLEAGANRYLIKPDSETIAPTIFQLVR
jgi:two-component system, OmpR family, response regulator RegX3